MYDNLAIVGRGVVISSTNKQTTATTEIYTRKIVGSVRCV